MNRKSSAAIRESPIAPSFVDRNAQYLVWLILLGALLIRIIALHSFSVSLYGDFLQWDERVYQAWAQSILSGKSFVVHDFSPLPAYVMAAVYLIWGIDPDHVRMFNIVLGVFTCLFIYFIGRDLAGRTAGLISCLIAALYKPFIFFSISILKESLCLFLFSAAICLFISLMKELDRPLSLAQDTPEDMQRKRGRPWAFFWGKIFLLGISAGLLINVRQNSIVLLPVFPVILAWMMLKRALPPRKASVAAIMYLMGIIISLSPFSIRNYCETGEFRASPAGGFHLYLANNINNPYPYYRPVPFATSIPSEQAVQFIIEASRRAGKKLSPGEASDFWTREVVRTAREHPGLMASKLWQKTLALFNRYEKEDNFDLGFISRFIPFFRLPFIAYWFVFPLGMGRLILSARTSGKARASAIVFGLYAATLIVFFSSMRIRIPLLVILIPYAAMGIEMLINILMKKAGPRSAYSYLIAVALLFSVECLPVAGADDLTAHYNTHALNLSSKGFRSEAIRYWEESSAMNRPYSDFANLSLALRCYQTGDFLKGDGYLNRIPDDSIGAAGKYSLLGERWNGQNRVDKAIAAYEMSLQINPGQIRAITKLIRLYEGRDPRKAQEKMDYLAYIKSFYSTGRGF